MSDNKCPNCGGTSSTYNSNGKAICDYCGSEFAVSDDTATIPNQTPAQRLLDFSGISRFESDACKKHADVMCEAINSGLTVESCLTVLKDIASKHKEWAVEEANSELMNKIKPKVQSDMSSGEKMLFYKDGGVFSTGKSGVLITNENIFRIGRFGINKIALKEIKSIHGLWSSWYFNSDRSIEIDYMACSSEELGIIMALVCLLVQRQKGKNFKIKVFNGVM